MNGEDFRIRRILLGLTKRKDCASHIGVSIDTVKDWELGRRKVPTYAIRSLDVLEKAKGKRR